MCSDSRIVKVPSDTNGKAPHFLFLWLDLMYAIFLFHPFVVRRRIPISDTKLCYGSLLTRKKKRTRSIRLLGTCLRSCFPYFSLSRYFLQVDRHINHSQLAYIDYLFIHRGNSFEEYSLHESPESYTFIPLNFFPTNEEWNESYGTPRILYADRVRLRSLKNKLFYTSRGYTNVHGFFSLMKENSNEDIYNEG